MNNNNILNNGFIIKEEFYDITKEIPVLSNANIIYNEMKKISNIIKLVALIYICIFY